MPYPNRTLCYALGSNAMRRFQTTVWQSAAELCPNPTHQNPQNDLILLDLNGDAAER